MDANRLVLRGGRLTLHSPEPHISSAAGVGGSAAAMLAPGIVGALSFFLIVFVLVAAYWRCRRRVLLHDNDAWRRTPLIGAESTPADCSEHGCRIIVNPLDCTESIPTALTGRATNITALAGNERGLNDEEEEDFSDIDSLASSSCSGDCEDCRRDAAGLARLASSEEEMEDDAHADVEYADADVDDGDDRQDFRKACLVANV